MTERRDSDPCKRRSVNPFCWLAVYVAASQNVAHTAIVAQMQNGENEAPYMHLSAFPDRLEMKPISPVNVHSTTWVKSEKFFFPELTEEIQQWQGWDRGRPAGVFRVACAHQRDMHGLVGSYPARSENPG
jgi:hypothetical protein